MPKGSEVKLISWGKQPKDKPYQESSNKNKDY